mmetsp:Transcript_18287/g.25768  ORF Transcript_18287/g.25768 Transcript_18287/m.25768 type:complete len:526 (+) Transcript_18287:172-1749(+)
MHLNKVFLTGVFGVFLANESFTFVKAFAYLPRVQTLCKNSKKTCTSIRATELKNEVAREPINLSSLNEELKQCSSGDAADSVLKRVLLGSNDNDDRDRTARYGSVVIPRGASDRGISDGDLAIQTRIRNSKYSIMDLIELNGDRDADRASLALLCLMVGSSASALAANQSLPGPEIFRFAVVWLFSFAPFFFVGYGIATPEELQALLVSVQRTVFPTYQKRMVQHEAGHFLIGHLLGMPVKGYKTNAVKNAVEFYPLNNPEAGSERAKLLGFDSRKPDEEVYVPEPSVGGYFEEGGRGAETVSSQSVFRNAKNYTDNPFLKLPSQNNPTESWPYRGFDHDTVDKLAVISVAGVCAEILAFGNAEGGYADLSQLRQLFNNAEPELSERDMENRIRFALGFGMSQLRLHLGALDELAEVMARGGSVAECVLAIESCKNLSGDDAIFGTGNYERERRNMIRSEGVGIVERLFLGDKNADTKETDIVEGKGGGYRKEKFVLTGDDPLYAALAAATAFFIWASSGGLSLH